MSEKKDELKEIQKLQGHTGNPSSGINGEPVSLASCGADKTLRIWTQNPQTSAFECLKTFEGARAGTCRSCSWSREGSFLAIPGYDGFPYIWDKIEDKFFDMHAEEEVDKEEVLSVSWDHTDRHVVTCCRASVRIWERQMHPTIVCSDELEKTGATMFQFHPSKDILFSCGCGDTIDIWNLYDYQVWYVAQTLDHVNKTHSSKGCSISFNATGDKMITSRKDLSIKVWGPERKQSGREYVFWEHKYTLFGHHEQPISSVHWSSEGIIASGAADGAIRLFVENQEALPHERGRAMYKLLLVKEKAHEADINSVQWTPKSQDTGEAESERQMPKKRTHEMDVNSSQQVLKERHNDMLRHLLPKEKISAVQWGPKGISLLASSSDKGSIKIWELIPGH